MIHRIEVEDWIEQIRLVASKESAEARLGALEVALIGRLLVDISFQLNRCASALEALQRR